MGLQRPPARVALTLTQEHAFERRERALAPLGRSSLRKGLSFGSASSRASSGGMASWRVSSSVSSCPVTLARRVRVRRPRRHGHSAGAGRARGSRGGLAVRHGGALQHQPSLRLWGKAAPCADTVAPVDALVDGRDFPTPASPTSATTCPWPAAARARAWPRAASSVSRPTKRVGQGRRGLEAVPQRTRPDEVKKPPPAP